MEEIAVCSGAGGIGDVLLFGGTIWFAECLDGSGNSIPWDHVAYTESEGGEEGGGGEFSFEDLDSDTIIAAFSGGFVIVATAFCIGAGVKAILDVIRRG